MIVSRLKFRIVLGALLGTVAHAAEPPYYLADNPSATYLIGGVGFEQIAFEAYTYDQDFNVLGSVTGRYSDTTARGDLRNYDVPSDFTPRVSVYWNGEELSDFWDGESGMAAGDSVGGRLETSPVGRTINTTRRGLLTELVGFKNFDTEGEVLDRALQFKLSGSPRRISIKVDSTGYNVTALVFSGSSLAGSSTITWSYSTDGTTVFPVGAATTIDSPTVAVFTVNLAGIPALQGASTVWLIASIQGLLDSSLAIDNLQVIGVANASGASAPTISGTPPVGSQGVPYNHTFTLTGTPAPTLSVTTGVLPPGLSLTATGISGTPAIPGNYPATVRASNAAGSADLSFTLTIQSPPTLQEASSGPPPAGTVGAAYSYAYVVGGFPTPTVVVVTGGLPSGLTLSGSTLTGVPAAAGTFTGTLRATNAAGSADLPFSITIHPATSPPSFTQQPQSQTVVVGATAQFVASVSGSPAPTLRWRRNGVDVSDDGRVSGATTATLTISNVVLADAGNYSLVATNSEAPAGVESNAAALTVVVPPSLSSAPTSQTVVQPQGVTFTVTVAGTATAPFTYTWRRGGTPVRVESTSSYTDALVLASTSLADEATYTVEVANAFGSAVSPTFSLTVNQVPSFTQQPSGATRTTGGSVTFTAAASGKPAPTWSWRVGSVPLVDGVLPSGTVVSGATTPVLTLTNLQVSDSGTYTATASNAAGSTSSAGAVLTVQDPATIVTQPSGVDAATGDTVQFTVAATGTPSPSFQWSRNGVVLADGGSISGATTATLTISSASRSEHEGSYTVKVANGIGSPVTSNPALLRFRPSILASPTSQTVVAGNPFTLTVSADGTAPLSYQWKLGGSPIPGAVGASYFVASADRTLHAGTYTVEVSNATGTTVTSGPATVTVQEPASILSFNGPSAVVAGGNAVFTVVPSGFPATFTYTWRRNGAVLGDGGSVSGATTAELTLTGAAAADAGAYTVEVFNGVGVPATSLPIFLRVVTRPVVSPAGPLDIVVGEPMDLRLEATEEPTSWSASGLPPGLAIGNDGRVTGTPTSVGTFDASVTASNAAGTSDSVSITFIVNPTGAPVVTSAAAATAVVGSSFTYEVEATNFPTGYAVTGTLPAGLAFLPPNQIAGVPTVSGVFTVTVSATNAVGTGSRQVTLTVEGPPSIVVPPPASVAITAGQTLSLSVTASGTPPPSFQWLLGGLPIPGATASTYTRINAPEAASGTYSVRVFNTRGEVVSGDITVTVNPPLSAPVITQDPTPSSLTVLQGQTVAFTVAATGNPAPSFQWRRNGVNLPGRTGTTLTLDPALRSDAGSYDVVVTNSQGSTVSAQAVLVVHFAPQITVQPAGLSVPVGGTALLFVGAVGSPEPSYQWRKDGVNLPEATGSSLTLSSVSDAATGSYDVVVSNSVGSVTSAAALVTVNAGPIITDDPESVSVIRGQSFTLTVGAVGTPSPHYQWRKGGVEIPGATGPSYTVVAATPADAGIYDVVVTNAAGSVTSAAASVTVISPPVITVNPSSRSVVVGEATTFTAGAAGSPPLSYQWKRNGTALAGATDVSFTIGSVQPGDAGDYTVTVSNAAGEATSAPAVLTVLVPVAITAQPTAQTVLVGEPAVFSVVATGTAPLSYQWRRNGAPIPGADRATLNLSVTSFDDAGIYDVVVSNAANSVISTGALLTLETLPTIVVDPLGRTLAAGDNLDLSVVATGTAPLSYQWRRNGTPIPGATSPTLSRAPATADDSGVYDVVVSNTRGSVTSSPADVAVVTPPVIRTQPSPATVAPVGSAVTFSVDADAPSASLQWFRNGVPIPGATGASFTLAAVTPADASAEFTCSITNIAGSVTSTVARLVLFEPAERVVGAGGGAFTIAVYASAEASGWTVTSGAGWLSLRVDRGAEGGGTIRYTVATGGLGVDRTGEILLALSGASAAHRVAQREMLVVDEDFRDGVPAAFDVPVGEAVVLGTAFGRSSVLAASTSSPARTRVRTRAPLAASSNLRLEADVLLDITSTSGEPGYVGIGLTETLFPPGNADGGNGLRFGLSQFGTGGQVTLDAAFAGEDGVRRRLDPAAMVARPVLGSRWVRLIIEVHEDRRAEFWFDPEPFGDPIRLWAPRTPIPAGLLEGRHLVIDLGESGRAGRAYVDRVRVLTGIGRRAVTGGLDNLSTRAFAGTGSRTIILGLRTEGPEVPLLIRGAGPSLAGFGISPVLTNPRLVCYDGTSPAPLVLRVQDRWQGQRDAAIWERIETVAALLGAFPFARGSLDSAWLFEPVPGLPPSRRLQTVHLRGADGGTGVALVELYRLSEGTGRLINLSTRAFVPAGGDVIPGWVISGNAARTYLIRAVGPGLQSFGVSPTLARPRLLIYQGSRVIAGNVAWGTARNASALAAAAASTGAFPLTTGSADSAVLAHLDPGVYTAVASSAESAASGVVLVELYEVMEDEPVSITIP